MYIYYFVLNSVDNFYKMIIDYCESINYYIIVITYANSYKCNYVYELYNVMIIIIIVSKNIFIIYYSV